MISAAINERAVDIFVRVCMGVFFLQKYKSQERTGLIIKKIYISLSESNRNVTSALRSSSDLNAYHLSQFEIGLTGVRI